jgi:phosphoribosylformylglycinamidine synthase
VQRALPRLGFDGIVDVRQGKRFEIELAGPADDAALAQARQIAEKLLANTVIEQFDVRFDTATDALPATGSAHVTDAAVAATASERTAG